jgi:hypothetical protein
VRAASLSFGHVTPGIFRVSTNAKTKVEGIANAIYENAQAFSLRDRDGLPYDIGDKRIVKRMRLFCRAAENLLLSDDVLEFLGTNWEKMTTKIDDWLSKYQNHAQFGSMNEFKTAGFDRINADVKSLRNIFMMLAQSQKPWEVAVGQAIAPLLTKPPLEGEHS